MPLSLNEIKDRALAFSREWEGERSESAEAQTFWNEFFAVFGVSRRRLASFEEPVKRARKRFEERGGGSGFIDLFWRGTLIAEHKSRGCDLDSAYKQALEYFEGLAERDLPHYVVVSDFARIGLMPPMGRRLSPPMPSGWRSFSSCTTSTRVCCRGRSLLSAGVRKNNTYRNLTTPDPS